MTVTHTMISADDHIDLGYLSKDLWTERLPKSLRDRGPHVEDRGDKGEFWVCDGETWGDYRGQRWFSRPKRNPLALDRGGVGEPGRPTTPDKRLADMDRDGVEASLMFPPIFAMQVGEPELRNACVQTYNDWATEFAQAAPKRFFPVAMLSPVDAEAAKGGDHSGSKIGLSRSQLPGKRCNDRYVPQTLGRVLGCRRGDQHRRVVPRRQQPSVGNRQGRAGGTQAGSAPDDFRYGTRQRRDFVFQSLCQSFQLRNIGATS